MKWKQTCVVCNTPTNDDSCIVCGNITQFEQYYNWYTLGEPLCNISHLRELGWYVHFATPDRVADRIHAARPPRYAPWFSKGNVHMWYSKGEWVAGRWENKELVPIAQNVELYNLLNQLVCTPTK